MRKRIHFTKMQGAGNDYVYVDGSTQDIPDPCKLARDISDRHFGVGSDGLVLILPSAVADIRMRMFNADGSEAEMCGNASRCVGKFSFEKGLVRKDVLSLETGAGIKILKLKIEDELVTGATVDMGEPILEPSKIPMILSESQMGDTPVVGRDIVVDGVHWSVTGVSMGNPHAVVFCEALENLNLPRIGPKFENHQAFPKKTNTEFVQIISRTLIKMRVWERGAGETLACGTGACAAVVACVLNGFTERKVDVELSGGTLTIEWNADNNHVYMYGPAVTVFTGEYIWHDLNQ